MPRIRKETSNRRSTNDRAKRRKQVKESKRKTAKAAKKSVQWKSKTPKDPGVPNEFPYKDQVLAEVAEQRRIETEEKERKKAQKQRALAKARAIARGEPFEDSDAEGQGGDNGDDEEEGAEKGKKNLNVGPESIAGLSAKVVGTQLKPRPRPTAEVEEEEEEDEEEVPVLINRDLPNLKTVLEKADVLLEVLDGRDPLAFRSKHIEDLGSQLGKKLVLVVNKIDTCPREAVASWSSYLRSQHPTFLFHSATSFLPEKPITQSQPQVKKGKATAKIPTNDAVGGDSVLACLAQLAKEKNGDEPLVVAVVGVTNVGKSSLINSLLKRAALPVYTLASSSRGPTTTELPQEVTLDFEDQKILFIDTPGLSFISKGEGDDEGVDNSVLEEYRARDILLRSKGRIDRLKDPNPPIAHIVSRANNEDLMLMYSLPAFAKGDPTAFLSGVARSNQLLKKKGELDLTGAARIVLRDWSVGKFSHYAIPPLSKATEADPVSAPDSTSTPAKPVNAALEKLYEKDVSILDDIPTRKEKRKAGGLVRLTAGVTDERQVSVEEAWACLQNSQEEESEKGDDVEDVDEEMAVDEEEEEEGEGEGEDDEDAEEEDDEEQPDSDEEEEAPPMLSNKQKRKRVLEKTIPERPSKKVAFATRLPPKKSRSASKGSPDALANSALKPVHNAAKKPAKSAVTGSKPIKSSLKGSVGSTPAKPSSDVKAKVANVSTKPKVKAPSGAEKSGNGPEAYDFGKFF